MAAQLISCGSGPAELYLMTIQFRALLKQLFGASPETMLPKGVFPLCNNTARDYIVAMMPEGDASGVLPTWQPPSPQVLVAWRAGLVETASKVEEGMIHSTTP